MADEKPSIITKIKALPLLPIFQTLVVFGSMGFLYYSKLHYKRPAITEEDERRRILAERDRKPPPAEPMLIVFEPNTVNIKTIPENPLPAKGTSQQIRGKFHYATVAFSMEIRDKSQQALMEAIKPLIQDKVVQILGRKQFHELANVQGRYVLMTELIESANHFVSTHSPTPQKEPLVSNLYFTQFIVQ